MLKNLLLGLAVMHALFYFTLPTFSVKMSTDLVKDVNLFRIACQPYQENYRDHIISPLHCYTVTLLHLVKFVV